MKFAGMMENDEGHDAALDRPEMSDNWGNYEVVFVKCFSKIRLDAIYDVDHSQQVSV